MKKLRQIICLLLILSCSFIFFACFFDPSPNPNPNPQEQEQEQDEDQDDDDQEDDNQGDDEDQNDDNQDDQDDQDEDDDTPQTEEEIAFAKFIEDYKSLENLSKDYNSSAYIKRVLIL